MKFIVVETDTNVLLVSVDAIVGLNVTVQSLTYNVGDDCAMITDIVNMDELVEDLLNLRG